MKVLLVSANRETLPDPVFPLGLAYVAGALEDAGHEVSALDLCFVDGGDVEASLAEAVERARPDVVGIAIRNVDDAAYPRVTSYLDHYRRVVSACRGATAAPLVLGGAGFTVMPGPFLAALEVDYGIVGEGERTLPALVEALGHAGTPLPPGVIARRGAGAGAPAPRLDGWGSRRPARGHFDAGAYYERGGMLSLQTRRGCPHRCIYCTYPHIEGRRVRPRPVVEAVDELEALVADTGVGHVFIVDSVFTHPRAYALAFCRELAARRVAVRWSCYASASDLDGELVEAMVAAGCEGVELGTDALVDPVLETLGKGFTYAEVVEASRLCRELGLRFAHFLFLGAPGEGLDEARLAVDRLAELRADSSLIMTGIRIFPGTALAERARAELGVTEIDLDPVFYVSPALAGHLERLVADVVADHPAWVLPGVRRNFDERIQRVLRRAGKRGVLWDFLAPR